MSRVRAGSQVVIVGASVAGVNAAEALREVGYEGEVVLIGAERHLPYDRPPLSKQLLAGSWEAADLALRPESRYEELGVNLRLGTRAVALDSARRIVALDTGEELAYDGALIATGATPRMPRFLPRLEGVRVLRTVDDSLTLRAALARRPRLTVIGAGFIGSEVASTARAAGVVVTVVEGLAAPMAQALGPTVGGEIGRLAQEAGVRMLCGAPVAGLEGTERVEAVRLADGVTIPADLVVVGTGVGPTTEWLHSSGIELDDGVVCDARCATSHPGIYAAGDVARWEHPLVGPLRIEHWTNAVEQGRHAAANLFASLSGQEERPYAPTPYFWSDQHGRKVQFVGWPGPDTRLLHHEDGRLVALYGRDGRLCGALTVDAPRVLAALRRMVGQRAPIAEALEQAERAVAPALPLTPAPR